MKYSPGIDGIRAIAALLVVFFHAKVPGLEGGFIGVDIFFVMSGYLITRLLREEHDATSTIDYHSFVIRRFRRLYPALLLLITVCLTTCSLAFPQYPPMKHAQDALIAGLYLSDYARLLGLPLSVLNHTWSLAVEEQFYLLWPLAFLFLAKGTPRRTITLIIAAYLAITFWRFVNVQAMDYKWSVYERFDTHSSGLLLGCALGYSRTQIHSNYGILGIIGVIACLAFFDFKSEVAATWGFTAAEISSAFLVAAQPSWLGGTILPWLGRMSYGLYLWHYPFIRIARDRFWDWPETLVLGLLAGLISAVISHYFIERRFYQPRVKPFTEKAV